MGGSLSENAPPNALSWPIIRLMLASRLTTDLAPDATSNLLRLRRISQPRAQATHACRLDWTPPAKAARKRNRAQLARGELRPNLIRPSTGGVGGMGLAGHFFNA